LQIGGYDFDDAIVRVVQRQEQLLVGQEQAEQVKIAIGSALPPSEPADTDEIAGRDLTTGMLRRIRIDATQVRAALAQPLGQIVEAVKDLLERTPAELSSDIAQRGLTLVGGGSLLQGFDQLLRNETGLPVCSDPEPLTTVARGAGAALEGLASLNPDRGTRGRRRR
jgi:rod shape-determining protein MreB